MPELFHFIRNSAPRSHNFWWHVRPCWLTIAHDATFREFTQLSGLCLIKFHSFGQQICPCAILSVYRGNSNATLWTSRCLFITTQLSHTQNEAYLVYPTRTTHKRPPRHGFLHCICRPIRGVYIMCHRQAPWLKDKRFCTQSKSSSPRATRGTSNDNVFRCSVESFGGLSFSLRIVRGGTRSTRS